MADAPHGDAALTAHVVSDEEILAAYERLVLRLRALSHSAYAGILFATHQPIERRMLVWQAKGPCEGLSFVSCGAVSAYYSYRDAPAWLLRFSVPLLPALVNVVCSSGGESRDDNHP